jgi:hypothetical protein
LQIGFANSQRVEKVLPFHTHAIFDDRARFASRTTHIGTDVWCIRKVNRHKKKEGSDRKMSYEQSAVHGNWMGMIQFAVVNGALWAIGTSWSTAIRAVTLQMLPDDSEDVVIGELAAVGITTTLSVLVSYVVMRKRCFKTSEPDPPESFPKRVVHRSSRI